MKLKTLHIFLRQATTFLPHSIILQGWLSSHLGLNWCQRNILMGLVCEKFLIALFDTNHCVFTHLYLWNVDCCTVKTFIHSSRWNEKFQVEFCQDDFFISREKNLFFTTIFMNRKSKFQNILSDKKIKISSLSKFNAVMEKLSSIVVLSRLLIGQSLRFSLIVVRASFRNGKDKTDVEKEGDRKKLLQVRSGILILIFFLYSF